MPVLGSNRFLRARADIGERLHRLRVERSWSQAELAKRLGLSQPQLSKIERGLSSLTAEQFLFLLSLFNVPVTHFAENQQKDIELQNALARLGARHLYENAEVLPSEVLDGAQRAIREALVEGSPRFVTSLAPVIVQHSHRLNLPKLYDELTRLGLERRLGWLVDNVLSALDQLAQTPGPKAASWSRIVRRTETTLRMFQDLTARSLAQSNVQALDILDDTIRTKKTLDQVQASSSAISRRWGVVTGLQPDDFVAALEAADVAL